MTHNDPVHHCANLPQARKRVPPFKLLSVLLGLSLAAGMTPCACAAETDGGASGAPGFKVTPNVSLSESWNDNIYGTPSSEKSDSITTVTASVKANSDWSRHRLGLDGGAAADFYSKYDSENVVDWWLGADGRYDLSADSHALGGIRFSQDHEDRSSPDSATGAKDPTTYMTSSAHLGFAHRLGPFTIRLGGVVENLNFDNGSTPTFDVNWRDRTQYSVGTRFSYALDRGREVFFQAATDTRDYRDSTVGRNSDGHRLSLGMRVSPGANFEAEGFLGHMVQDYDNVALKDVSGLYYGASLRWKPVAPARITGTVDRSINETTLTGASSHLDSSVSGRVDYDLTSQLALNASLAYTNSDYQGISLEFDEYSAGLGARYYFDRRFFLSGGYRYANRDASAPTYDYTRNLFFVSLGFAPRKP